MGMRRVLFLDDRSNRINSAIRKYNPPNGYDLTIVTTVKECIAKLSNEHPWDIVSLDHDLGFDSFVNPLLPGTGMEVVRWLEENNTFFMDRNHECVINIHTSNQAAADQMLKRLHQCDYYSVYCWPWEYPKYYKSLIAGAFDVIHPGYIKLFKKAKELSSHLTIALNVSPKGKKSPVLSADDREERLLCLRQVDNVIRYEDEATLHEILRMLSLGQNMVWVMGDDHKKPRHDVGCDVYYMERYGDWSATKLKKMYCGAKK